jgi:PAS domain-containing protein
MSQYHDSGNRRALSGPVPVNAWNTDGDKVSGDHSTIGKSETMRLHHASSTWKIVSIAPGCYNRRLREVGYHADLANDGEEGLALWRSGSYDALCVGYAVPKLNGLDIIRILAVEGLLPPIVMITGAGDEAIAVEAMKLGAYDYVIKDSQAKYLDLIPHVIDQALEKKRLIEKQAESSRELEKRVKQRTSELELANEALKREINERRSIEDALRESEERYRAVFNNAAIGIDLVDNEGRFSHVNASLAGMLGYTQEELHGRSFRDVTHPQDVASSRKLHKLLSAEARTIIVWRNGTSERMAKRCGQTCLHRRSAMSRVNMLPRLALS